MVGVLGTSVCTGLQCARSWVWVATPCFSVETQVWTLAPAACCPHWHVILIVVARAFGGSVTIWGSWWHFGRQTPLLVPWKDTCVGG